MENFFSFVSQLNSFAWGFPVLLVVPIYIYFTFKTEFIQKKIFKGLKLSLTKHEQYGQGVLSPFRVFCTELAVTFGIGNVIGIATSVIVGGVGAVFWVFIISLFGVAIKYCEAYIASRFRQKMLGGEIVGGVMIVYDKILKQEKLAILFATLCLISSTIRLFSLQVHFICDFCNKTFNTSILSTGIVVVSIISFFIFLGIDAIVEFSVRICIPTVVIYFVLCFTVIATNLEYLLPALFNILHAAFSFESLSGGLVGSSILVAFKEGGRIGLYSTESGMGELSVINAYAQTRNPFRQALISSTVAFLDGVVCCPLTGLTVVIAFLKVPSLKNISNISGAYVIESIFSNFPMGDVFLTIIILVIAFSMALTSYTVSRNFFIYLFKTSSIIKFKVIYLIVGSFIGLKLAKYELWNFLYFIDIFKILLTFWAIFVLKELIIKETKDYSVGKKIDIIKDTEILYKEKNIEDKKLKIFL
jgi:AGCS family alanine or glycine:cation symporter